MNEFMSGWGKRLTLAAPETPEVREADLDLTAMVRLVRRRSRFIIVTVAILTVLALPFILAIEPLYNARARFLVQAPMSLAPPAEQDALDLSSEVERLRSRAISDRVIEQFDLSKLPEFNADLRPRSLVSRVLTVLGSFRNRGDEAPATALNKEKVVAAFYGRLSVWREAETSVLQIGFTSTDPQLAADIPNAMIDIYLTDREGKSQSRLATMLGLLDAEMTAQRSNVEATKHAVRIFQQESGITSVGRAEALEGSRVVLMNEQLADIQRQRAELRGRVATVDAALSGEALVPLGETETLTEMRQNLQVKQAELARLTATYGEAYGGVLTERSRVAGLEEAIRRELTAWGASLRAQITQLDGEEVALSALREAVQGSLSKTSVAELELVNLIRRADAQRDILDVYENQHRLLETRIAQPSIDLEVLSWAVPAVFPEGRGRKIYLMFVVIGAGFFALTLAGALEATDHSTRSLAQFSTDRNLIPLGMLPILTDQGDHLLRDALRGVALSLRSASGGTLPDSMMITPVRSGDGASFVARHLVSELVAEEQSILLIDAIGEQKTPGPKGLGEYLRGEANLNDLITASPTSGVSLLPRGNGMFPALRDSAPVQQIIDHALAQDMKVIFICPSVLGSASVVQMAALMDRVVLVMRWGRTPLELVRLASDRLTTGGVGSAMILLNRVDPKRHALYPYRDAARFSETAKSNGW